MRERALEGFEGVRICGLGCRTLGLFCTYRRKALETVLGFVGKGLGFRGQGLEPRYETMRAQKSYGKRIVVFENDGVGAVFRVGVRFIKGFQRCVSRVFGQGVQGLAAAFSGQPLGSLPQSKMMASLAPISNGQKLHNVGPGLKLDILLCSS